MLTQELLGEFLELKKRHDAIVLAHYYVESDAPAVILPGPLKRI